jgi:FemAB-related protein (PEP-CTERM system-associated)
VTLHCREFSEADTVAWDAFVSAHPQGTFFHLSGWRTVLQRAFGLRTHFLLAERDGAIAGVLPLARVKSLLFGHTLASLPFCVYGGILADDEAAEKLLRDEACRLAEASRVDALEMRNLQDSGSGWPGKALYATFRKPIDPDHDVNMKAIPNKQRAMVRKGIKAGLESDWDDGTGRLYRVYAESVRNLGTPVFTSRYFRVLREVFGEACSILMITHEGEDVAGVLNFYFRDQVLPYYGGSVTRARSIKGSNDFMYWELMRRSADDGYRLFDFGRSKEGTGPYSFKKNWGFVPEPLHYEYYLVKSPAVPDVNPLNPKYRFFIETWKKLPLPVANLAGPWLARHLG